MTNRHKIILYNPRAVFWTMPLGLIAVGSALDPERYEVKIMDARLEQDPIGTLLAEAEGAPCVGVGVLTGDPIRGALEATLQIAKRLRAMSADFEAAIFYYKPYPGNELADQLGAGRYEFPCTLDGWADFDYVGSARSQATPWVSAEKYARVERFKFYQKYAYGRHSHPLARPLQTVSRWRVERDSYGFPVKQLVVEALHPAPRLS